ncbi:MAG: TlyA family rRNA (cytidine-2'-O)-methyltransferase [Phycisphaeraceae bacterium]|nr:TlyA family rRNA (cytidine-2'-O)-methyltransferase [Phycisphaeraceae bacterium]
MYVSRGGLKLEAALDAWALDVEGQSCADLGCSTGGFTDCLLQRGADRVYSVDSGYGVLEWKLRQDPRVTVLERTNAIHFDPGTLDGFTGCDLVVIDLGWTRQQFAVPAALRWLRRGARARIVSLVKPHYEAERAKLRRGVLDDDEASATCERTLAALTAIGVNVIQRMPSPIRGGGSRKGGGNVEFLALLQPAGG